MDKASGEIQEKRRKAIQQSFVSEKKIIWQGTEKEATGKIRGRGKERGETMSSGV